MLLRDASIGKKLFLLILISLLFFGVIGGTGFYFMNQMKSSTEGIYNNALHPIQWQDKISLNNQAIESYTLELLLTPDSKLRQQFIKQIEDTQAENDQLIEQLEKNLGSESEIERLAVYKEEYQAYMKELQQVYQYALAGQGSFAYIKYQQDVMASRERATGLMTAIGNHLETYAESLNEKVTRDNQISIIIISAVFLLSIAIEVVIGYIIVRRIANPIKDIQSLMEKAEQGDLTIEGNYKSKDEIGQLTISFNRMLHNLREIMRQVSITSEHVAASSEQLTASAEQSSKASEEIAATIQEVASGADHQVHKISDSSRLIEDMSLNVQQIASNAQSLSTNALEASHKAIEGNEAIQSTIKQMNSINATVTQLSKVIKGLGDRSREIGNIIETITNIASQTNLLALNAAIESARAGEHGRGFAVVADEVRKLAVQSEQSANSISNLIALIQKETQTAVHSMEKTTSEVIEGIGVVNNVQVTFEQIRHSIEDVSQQLLEVSATTQQMAAGSEQVLHAEKELAVIAERAASGTQNVAAAIEEQLASTEEISASAGTLAVMAGELQDQLGKFKV